MAKKVGIGGFKMPLWGWAAAGVGGFLLYRKLGSGGTSGAAASSPMQRISRGKGKKRKR